MITAISASMARMKATQIPANIPKRINSLDLLKMDCEQFSFIIGDKSIIHAEY
jgi:hypothetical protein